MRRLRLWYQRWLPRRMRCWGNDAIGPWWLGPWPGRFADVPPLLAADVVIAYQPKWAAGSIYARGDAASKANSLVNLADPGTNDATEIAVTPWSAVNGWEFDGVGILQSVVPNSTYSLFVQFDNAAGYMAVGCTGPTAGNMFYLLSDFSGSSYYGIGSVIASDPVTSGNMGVSGVHGAILNGITIAPPGVFALEPERNIWVGQVNDFLSPAVQRISAMGLYENITKSQIEAVSWAMNQIGAA